MPGCDLLFALRHPYTREQDGAWFKHIGLYVYRRDFLLGYSRLPVARSSGRALEQLRALENGYPIRVIETDYESLGVDTPKTWNGSRGSSKLP